MKVFYNPFTSSGSTGNVTGFEGKLFYLIPAFVLAVFLGFCLDLLTVARLNLFAKIPLYRESYLHHHHFHHQRQQNFVSPASVDQFSSSSSQIQSLSESPDYTRTTFSKNADAERVVKPNVPLWEKSTLFNISNFQWVRNNESICQVDPRHPDAKIILILVHTARSHFTERLTIRKSWGSLLFYKNWSVRLAFLIGEADRGLDPKRNEVQFRKQELLLDQEQQIFGDIVQGNFIDTYRNLTYKHMMGYKWTLNFCSSNTTSFILKADDDIFIDVMQIINWRNEELRQNDNSSKTFVPDIYCNTFVGTKPQRCVGCKWFISEAEWPSEISEFYPDYCSGWFYAITVDLLRKLYLKMDTAPFFWVDDVYTTGVLMEQLKKDIQGFKPKYRHLWGLVRMYDFRNFRPMCERNDMQMERKFGAVVPVPRESNFERDMKCLWNKTVYDDLEEETKRQTVGNQIEKDDNIK